MVDVFIYKFKMYNKNTIQKKKNSKDTSKKIVFTEIFHFDIVFVRLSNIAQFHKWK